MPTSPRPLGPAWVRSSLLAASAAVWALAIALAGCAGENAQHAPSAEPPPAPAPNDAGEAGNRLASGYLYRFDMLSPANDNFAVTTREVYLYFRPDTSAVQFQLENRLGLAIRVLWDECTFTNTDGRTFKAVHRGIRYDNRLDPQEPTWVQPGQRLGDYLVPVDLLNDPTAAADAGAMRKLFPTDVSARGFQGKVFGVNLVLDANNQRLEFPAHFKVLSVYPAP